MKKIKVLEESRFLDEKQMYYLKGGSGGIVCGGNKTHSTCGINDSYSACFQQFEISVCSLFIGCGDYRLCNTDEFLSCDGDHKFGVKV